MSKDSLNAREAVGMSMTSASDIDDILGIKGTYGMVCTDADGNVLWHDEFDNLVVTVGQNQLLNAALGSGGATSTAFMGLIGGSGTVIAATDTTSSHPGWVEANASNAPNYGTTRPTLSWGAASGGEIQTTGTNQFVFTNSGTVQGALIVYGSGASSSNTSTTGVLLSAGLASVPQPVVSGNTVTVSYALTL